MGLSKGKKRIQTCQKCALVHGHIGRPDFHLIAIGHTSLRINKSKATDYQHKNRPESTFLASLNPLFPLT